MKKSIMLSFILAFLILPLSIWAMGRNPGPPLNPKANIIVNGAYVNGMLRGSCLNWTNLIMSSSTNALRNDMYVCLSKIHTRNAGIYQSKINHPLAYSNWNLIYEMLGTNFLHSFPQQGTSWTNTSWTTFTNALHNAMTAQFNSSNQAAVTRGTNLSKTYTRSYVATSTNTLMNNLTNYFCWAEVIQTNFTVPSFTPRTNTTLRGTNFSLWTNIATSYISTGMTNLLYYNSTNRMFRIGSAGLGNYEMSYSLTYICSSTNTLNFALLFNGNPKIRFLKAGGSGDPSHSVSCSAIINVNAPKTIGLGVVQANGQTSTVQLKNVVIYIHRIR